MKHTAPPKNGNTSRPKGEQCQQFEPSKLGTAHDELCKIDRCKKKHFSRGWCQVHYRRWSRYGHPLARSAAGKIMLPANGGK